MKCDVTIADSLNLKATVHRAVDPPICEECKELDLSFFDPTCSGCQDILSSSRTTVSEIFAIIRQWVPQTQQNIERLVNEILKRGAHVDDRDGLTDMTLLHYVAKSGADGVGDVDLSCRVTHMLMKKGCNVLAKCRWTDMIALHYAVFFDVAPVVDILLTESKQSAIDRPCKEYDNGTALHIACSNLSFKSAKTLIDFGASPHYPDKNGKLPVQCIPTDGNYNKDTLKIIQSLQTLLSDAMSTTAPNTFHHLNISTLQALGLDLFDQVIVAGKVGILKFCGSTQFASGQWAGIELSEPVGKNDGSVNGIQYFKCKPRYGIFAPLTRVNKFDGRLSIPLTTESYPRAATRTEDVTSLNLGNKVIVAGQKIGRVRYLGPTKFANGTWVGVELKEAAGKNNGSVGSVKYFECKEKHGVFAPLSKVKKFNEKSQNERLGNAEVSLAGGVDDVETKDSIIDTPDTREAKTRSNINRSNSLIPTTKMKKEDSNEETFGSMVNFTLKNGMSVYVNNDLGIVKYIGRVDFSDGVWLGIELRRPNGKNDGVIEGKQYFNCKPNHGLMVRPNRATCRGINCSQLVDIKFR